MFEAKCSASPTPRAETASRNVRCLPGILSNHSSSAWRVACQAPPDVPWASTVDALAPSAVPAATSPPPSLERNDRRAKGDRTSERCMCTSLRRAARRPPDEGNSRRHPRARSTNDRSRVAGRHGVLEITPEIAGRCDLLFGPPSRLPLITIELFRQVRFQRSRGWRVYVGRRGRRQRRPHERKTNRVPTQALAS